MTEKPIFCSRTKENIIYVQIIAATKIVAQIEEK